MKSDVHAIQINQTRKVSYSEYALIAIILLVATKFCTLPSILSSLAASKAVWVAVILLATDIGVFFFSTEIARCGGLTLLPIKSPGRIPLLLFFALFFALKLTAFTREISTYYALSLFENAPVLPISVLLLISCSLLAQKGYMGVGRVSEIFVWLFAFVFLFVVIFTRTEGDLFNALSIVNPDASGMGRGIGKGMAWFGDSIAIAFLDLRGLGGDAALASLAPARKKAKGKILFAALAFSFLFVMIFYAVFISVYGEAAKMTDYAFIKLSAFKANTDELGSADWPVIILWSIVTCLYLTLMILSGKECLTGLAPKQEKKRISPYFLLGGIAVVIATLFLDEEGDYEGFMTNILAVITYIAAGVTVAVGTFAIKTRKGGSHESAL